MVVIKIAVICAAKKHSEHVLLHACSPHLLVTPAVADETWYPGISQNATCAVGDFA